MPKRARPEHSSSASASHYDEAEALRYTNANATTQDELAQCCLWHVQRGAATQAALLMLDLGCGSGLSSLRLERAGHRVIGVDVSSDMLHHSQQRERPDSLLVHANLAGGLPFAARAVGLFDGAISVSVLQWLTPASQLKLFSDLRVALRPLACAVLQFYPTTPSEAQAGVDAAVRAGLDAELAIDMPHASRARKLFLCVRRRAHEQAADSAPAAATDQLAERPPSCPLAYPMPASCRCRLRGARIFPPRLPELSLIHI